MAFQPEPEPDLPARLGGALQREVGAVPLWWLPSDDEATEQARRVDRLAADADLVTTLALAGYQGADYDLFATELSRYGLAVIGAWMRQGMILAKCKQQKGLHAGLRSIGRGFSPDEVIELSGETVAAALRHFREDVLMRNKWRPDGGATLRTFFIGQCLFRFANVYKRWEGEIRRSSIWTSTEDEDLLTALGGGSPQDVERQAINRLILDDRFARIKNPNVRRAMVYTAMEWTQQQIAVELGVTEKAVERMLANERARQRQSPDKSRKKA
ncbi:sigma-70 family RNA polymerase sigma factor [Pseudactinotalea terrae]|uniref:sigma-70 family RNA polymerase sigma factor n=1 Tax=Pseudactinotalea terrae TaxID=1743262 RepID=UPI0012E1BB8B|nr:sigma-70 family RNA polymerase sigma factor [Pseudactinotalea terrae]